MDISMFNNLAGYIRVSVAERFDTDQHPDVVPGLKLTLAPLHLIVICKMVKDKMRQQKLEKATYIYKKNPAK